MTRQNEALSKWERLLLIILVAAILIYLALSLHSSRQLERELYWDEQNLPPAIDLPCKLRQLRSRAEAAAAGDREKIAEEATLFFLNNRQRAIIGDNYAQMIVKKGLISFPSLQRHDSALAKSVKADLISEYRQTIAYLRLNIPKENDLQQLNEIEFLIRRQAVSLADLQTSWAELAKLRQKG